ncbi:unnamed protein product, partial [marine sediment metagenome]
MVLEELLLNDKVALIAGQHEWAEQAALALAEAGCDISIAASDSEYLTKISKSIGEMGRRNLAISTDVANASQVHSAVDRVISEFGKIDILINSPWVEFAKPFVQVNETEWHYLINKILTSTFLITREVGQHMLVRHKGAIVNIISALAIRVSSNNAAFCANMAAIHHLTKALALEWARD